MDRSRNDAAAVAALKVVVLLAGLGMIALNAWFLFYVDRLEKRGCKCAMGWRRRFIEVSLLLFVIMQAIGLFVNWQDHFLWLSLAYQLLYISYVFVTREFIQEMKSSACECAETEAFEWLDVVNIIQIALLALALVVVLSGVLVWATMSPGGAPKASKSTRGSR